MLEHHFQCPYCWEGISMLLDHSVIKTTYIEDCEVCCRPIEITATFNGQGDLSSFLAQDIDQ